MNIGEKVKNLRTSKLMTQKELAGDVITRNMLSQIESGNAYPSLQTLIYLANRLGVQVGYLVSDGGANETFYKKYANYSNLIESYRSKEWMICRDLCLAYLSDGTDNEITYMLAQASMHIGMTNFIEGKLKSAVRMFEEALDYCAMTVFDVGGIISCIKAYAYIMSMISPTLTFEIDKSADSNTVCADDLCKYTQIISSEHNTVNIPSENEWSDPGYYYILSAETLIKSGKFDAAISLLSHVHKQDTLPKPIIYLVLDRYEKCCKETDDYKDAYQISQEKLQLFEKMLTDD